MLYHLAVDDTRCNSAVVEAPSAASDTAGGGAVRCRRCGWSGDLAEAPGGACPQCRSFLPGNQRQLVHGLRRLRGGGGSPLDESRRREVEAAIAADLGGADELSEIARSLVRDLAAAIVLRDSCHAHLAALGPFTSTGKRRPAVDLYLAVSARCERLGALLGLSRRERYVDPHQRVRDAVERARAEHEAREAEERRRAEAEGAASS